MRLPGSQRNRRVAGRAADDPPGDARFGLLDGGLLLLPLGNRCLQRSASRCSGREGHGEKTKYRPTHARNQRKRPREDCRARPATGRCSSSFDRNRQASRRCQSGKLGGRHRRSFQDPRKKRPRRDRIGGGRPQPSLRAICCRSRVDSKLRARRSHACSGRGNGESLPAHFAFRRYRFGKNRNLPSRHPARLGCWKNSSRPRS